MFENFFKSSTALAMEYEKLSQDYTPAQVKENHNMTSSNVQFSVGPDPDSDGAVLVFVQSGGMTTTITMPANRIRQLVELLEVVVP